MSGRFCVWYNKNMARLKTTLLLIIFAIGIFCFAETTYAASPVLNFSDLIDGPKSGLNDGLGQGAIVTIWGNNLGSTQGNSKVYFKDSTETSREAAYVYEWTNATQHAGHPADLYTYHKMQDIMFSIPSGSADGAGKIYVEVNSIKSNELDFTVRSGNIYFVKATGNNGNTGTWNYPWSSPDYYTTNTGGGSALAGSICYVLGGTWTNPLVIGTNGPLQGTKENPYAIVAYPGQNVIVNSSESYNFASFYSDDWAWTISKFKLTGTCGIAGSVKWGRYIGLEITDHPTLPNIPNQTGGFLSGGSNNPSDPAHSIHNDGIIAYGIYMHDYAKGNTNSQQHTFYMSNRIGYSIEPFDIGWCYLKDNQSNHGIHVYDEGICGGWTGTCKIHNNVVVGQRGAGIDIGGGCAQGWGPWNNTFEVYNNTLIDCGRGPAFSTGQCPEIAMGFGGNAFAGFDNAGYDIKVYNNTIYGWGANPGEDEGQIPSIGALSLNADFGTFDFKNNIIMDTKDKDFYVDQGVDPTYYSNNLWYNGGDGSPAGPPSWDTNPITSDPLFINPSLNNFQLQSASPAINAGTSSVSSIISKDFLGISRPQGSGYDIGAFEYDEGAVADTVTPGVPNGLSVR